MGKREARYRQALFQLQRALDERSGGDHAFEILVAAAQSSREFLAYVVQQGIAVNQLNELGHSALYWVIGEGDWQAAAALLNQGADPNLCGDGNPSSLMVAAHRGNLDLVNLLLKSGADPTYCDRDGDSAHTVAEVAGHPAIVERLQFPHD
jgi:uncharacterized protein